MGVIDRTVEFQQILQELSYKEGATTQQKRAEPPSELQSKLNAFSAEIGAGIHKTSQKLQELRKMAKGKGIFDDKTAQIQELTYNVKQDIESLNQQIEVLEKQATGSGSNRNLKAHSQTMVNTLKTRLLEVTKEFKDALELRTKALESQEGRRQLYNFGPGAAGNPFGQQGDPEAGGGGGAMSQAQCYHSSRAEAVQNVQRTIGELGVMFGKMASLVSIQEEMIQRIDNDLDETVTNVEAGQDNLLKYYQGMSSNRKLLLKVFAILFFFTIFFIMFIA